MVLQAGCTGAHARYMRLQADPNFMNEAAGRIRRLRDRLRRWERLAGCSARLKVPSG